MHICMSYMYLLMFINSLFVDYFDFFHSFQVEESSDSSVEGIYEQDYNPFDHGKTRTCAWGREMVSRRFTYHYTSSVPDKK